mmetsp:Transcript_43797/g.106212  ORF Transcript_43797/g.106212 Transcript_43797/m.106212 type:complete len:223 (+) Transcript_43797:3-671(+)
MMKVLQGRRWESSFLIFFISHIPITLLVDGQGALSRLYPNFLRSIVAWYTTVFGDVLMKASPTMEDEDQDNLTTTTASCPKNWWFKSIICCELLFQVPFFFVAIHIMRAYSKKNEENEQKQRSKSKDLTSSSSSSTTTTKDYDCYPGWFKTLCLLYGSHVSTTLVPILATFVMSTEMTPLQKLITVSIYSPYLIFPTALLYFAAKDDVLAAVNYYYDNKKRS